MRLRVGREGEGQRGQHVAPEKAQFGEGYKELRFFRRDVLPSLSLALAAYPEAHVVVDEKRGLTLYRSAPPVPEKKLLAG